MKKQLESELISIAHKILKLTGREDLGKMQTEIALLYQKITILKFIEGHHEGELPESVEADSSFFESLEPPYITSVTNEVIEKNELEIPSDATDETTGTAIGLTEDKAPQTPEETKTIKETEVEAPQIAEDVEDEATEHDLRELSPSYAQLPIFDALEEAPQQTSLNDQLKSQGFQIGLNDRLAFVKGLFENSNEDYDRVLSQLSTLDSYEEAVNLLDSIIKPDYNNWEGQEDVEGRFLEIIENKYK
jgi:hypothetical protein